MGDKFDTYPLTITKDRYTGVYSGGEWTAWNCDADEVPSDISDDDVTCCYFWGSARDAKVKAWGYTHRMVGYDDFVCPVFGIGNSIESAVEDLNKRLSEVGTC